MAINLYSHVQVVPKSGSGVSVTADIPLRFLAGRSGNPVVTDPVELLRPLQLAAEATLKHVGSNNHALQVNVECEIPVAAGLGSSASTTVAIISAVARSKGSDTGIHHATRTLVGGVVQKSKNEKKNFRNYLAKVREISSGVARSLREGDDDHLGTLMYQNHELLRKIGVSHPKLDHLVEVARRAGALGAKLTGAGGGGCVIILSPSRVVRDKIARVLRREGGTPYKISMDTSGVESWPA